MALRAWAGVEGLKMLNMEGKKMLFISQNCHKGDGKITKYKKLNKKNGVPTKIKKRKSNNFKYYKKKCRKCHIM